MLCHGKQHFLVAAAIALMAATSILQSVSASTTTTTTSGKLPVNAAKTAYDVLAQNNLPRGVLPLGVKSYELNAGGAFEVTYRGECNFFVTFAGKPTKFRFDSSVSGTIKSGSISRLSGAKIQVESALLGFSQVSREGNLLNFRLQNGATRSLFASAFTQSAPCSGLLTA